MAEVVDNPAVDQKVLVGRHQWELAGNRQAVEIHQSYRREIVLRSQLLPDGQA